jgi:hypothetical protein
MIFGGGTLSGHPSLQSADEMKVDGLHGRSSGFVGSVKCRNPPSPVSIILMFVERRYRLKIQIPASALFVPGSIMEAPFPQ